MTNEDLNKNHSQELVYYTLFGFSFKEVLAADKDMDPLNFSRETENNKVG